VTIVAIKGTSSATHQKKGVSLQNLSSFNVTAG